jgi:enoyl-CoA hydratase/3-hydroxyacyl-CoA dehydrogenase
LASISKIGVVGAGTMGHGIAELFALYGYKVILSDISKEALKNALDKIRWSLDKIGSKRGVPGLADMVLANIESTTDLKHLASSSDYIIEAVTENIRVKKEVFKTLDKHSNKECILASNTSSIPISELAEGLKNPGRVIGLHFSNPPILIPAVEIVLSRYTGKHALDTTVKLVESIGKEYVLVKKDVPGFIVNRINLRIFSEALRMVEEGYPHDLIDKAFIHRLGFFMGLFETMDLVGLDVVRNVLNEMVKRGFETPELKTVDEMIKAGKLGLKTGEGFYKYPGPGVYSRVSNPPTEEIYSIDITRIIATGVNEAAFLIREEVADHKSIDKAMKRIMNLPMGILEYADEVGIDIVVEKLNNLHDKYGDSHYQPDALLEEMLKKGYLGKKRGRGFYKWIYAEEAFGPVNYYKHHDYALIKMNRPDKLNALNEEMWIGLRRALEHADEDPDIRAIVITGEGRAFCAGDDIKVMGGWKDISDAEDFFHNKAAPLLTKLLEVKKPVIMAVNGLAFGGGMEILLFGDIVVSSDKAEFSVPEVLIGAMPPMASTLGVLLLGRKILPYCLTGDRISPWQAKDLGVVDIVVPHRNFWQVVLEEIEKIRRAAPLGLIGVKKASNAIKLLAMSSLNIGISELIKLSQTRDFKEGMSAFREKRRPKWEGR